MMWTLPQVVNPDRLYPGDTLTIPAGRADARTETSRMNSRTARAQRGRAQRGRDRIAARRGQHAVAGHGGRHRYQEDVADRSDSRNRFADINGPISRRDGRDPVADIPDSRISARVDRLVDNYLAARAAGTPASIGTHLNYANPNCSSANNPGWINALDGPVLGRGDAVHRHGTTPELERYRPADVTVALPGGTAPAPLTTTTPSWRIEGNAVAADAGVTVKSDAVHISRLDAAMHPEIAAASCAA